MTASVAAYRLDDLEPDQRPVDEVPRIEQRDAGADIERRQQPAEQAHVVVHRQPRHELVDRPDRGAFGDRRQIGVDRGPGQDDAARPAGAAGGELHIGRRLGRRDVERRSARRPPPSIGFRRHDGDVAHSRQRPSSRSAAAPASRPAPTARGRGPRRRRASPNACSVEGTMPAMKAPSSSAEIIRAGRDLQQDAVAALQRPGPRNRREPGAPAHRPRPRSTSLRNPGRFRRTARAGSPARSPRAAASGAECARLERGFTLCCASRP